MNSTDPAQKPKGRGRPPLSGKQKAEMRDHISACALQLFQDEGFEAVSMRRLAKEADLTVMTLYKYFDSKIDILRAIWAAIFSELFEELGQVAANEKDPRKRLDAVALGYTRYWLKNTQNYFTVFMSRGISQADVKGFVDDAETLDKFQILSECLEAALPDGTALEVVRVKSEVLICILNGIAHNLITISSYPWAEPEVIVREAIEGLLGR